MPNGRIVVVGGGIVGLALARALACDAGADVVVLEKEPALGTHQTGHNSGVVHAGLYYPPGSLKARLCRRGADLLRGYCQDRGIALEQRGKVVVATSSAELAGLERIYERSLRNGVPGIAMVGPRGLADLQPGVSGVAAVFSPTTAIVDFAAVARAFADDAVAAGARVRRGVRVLAVRSTPGGVRVTVAGERPLLADRAVICAGLQADRLARAAGGAADPRIIPFRGSYYELRSPLASRLQRLIYPVPDPRYPFLGVHFTPDLRGRVLIGPNAVLALAREGYRGRDVSIRDVAASLSWPGFWHMARAHWRTGTREATASAIRSLYARAARRYVGGVRARDLVPAFAGVRAQAIARDGRFVDDFAIENLGAVVVVRNAPSPAATSALAIADVLVDLVRHGRAPAVASQ